MKNIMSNMKILIIIFFIFVPILADAEQINESIEKINKRKESILVTEVEIALQEINVALELYEMDNSMYPSSQQGLNVLLVKPDDPSNKKWNGPYLETKIRLTDPWGRSYVYNYPSTTKGEEYFDLYSLGPDGVENTKDDVGRNEREAKRLKIVILDPKESVELLKEIENIIDSRFFYIYESKPIEGGVVFVMETSDTINTFILVEALQDIPLFEDIRINYAKKNIGGVKFEIEFYFTNKVKEKQIRIEELMRLKTVISQKEFKKLKEKPETQKEIASNKIKNFKLIGIISDNNSSEPTAIIEVLDENKIYYIKKGDLIGQFTVVEIKKDSIILSKDDNQYCINVE